MVCVYVLFFVAYMNNLQMKPFFIPKVFHEEKGNKLQIQKREEKSTKKKENEMIRGKGAFCLIAECTILFAYYLGVGKIV